MAKSLKDMTDQDLTADFDKAQAAIVAAQQTQEQIDKERRRRAAAAQIEAKRADLKRLETDLKG